MQLFKIDFGAPFCPLFAFQLHSRPALRKFKVTLGPPDLEGPQKDATLRPSAGPARLIGRRGFPFGTPSADRLLVGKLLQPAGSSDSLPEHFPLRRASRCVGGSSLADRRLIRIWPGHLNRAGPSEAPTGQLTICGRATSIWPRRKLQLCKWAPKWTTEPSGTQFALSERNPSADLIQSGAGHSELQTPSGQFTPPAVSSQP